MQSRTIYIFVPVIFAGILFSGCRTFNSGGNTDSSGQVKVLVSTSGLGEILRPLRFQMRTKADDAELHAAVSRSARAELSQVVRITMDVPFSGNILVNYLSAGYNPPATRPAAPEKKIRSDHEDPFDLGLNFRNPFKKKKKKSNPNDGDVIVKIMDIRGRTLWAATCHIDADAEGSKSAAETADLCLKNLTRQLAKDIKNR